MKYIEALLMNLRLEFAVLFIVLGIAYGTEIFLIRHKTRGMDAVGFVGDLVIYPRTSNKVATAGDFVLDFVLIWLLAELWVENPETSMLMPALYSAALIAAGEWFYHIYLKKRLWEHKETSHTLKREPNRK